MSVQDKLVYPPGVRDITGDISTDDLVRRLKECAHAFQNMSQDDDNSAYIPLALHLASETFLEHRSRDVRLLVACCIADVFRVYAPEAPYKDITQLKDIFEFFVDQLKGLENPQNPSFKRYFYLLENLTCVKTFNICFELEDSQKILCRLFRLMFKIINDNHSAKVKRFILDMLSPLISEVDTVSQDLLDVILSQIVEPIKSQNRSACSLAQDILKRNVSTLEPYIQEFFNNALKGKTFQSGVSRQVYELTYELNTICPSMLVVVLPQLEAKIEVFEEEERIKVCKILARMFGEKNSTLLEQNKSLWSCFLRRFNDFSPEVRIICVQCCKEILLNHPEVKEEITGLLQKRELDSNENVRCEVVLAIIGAAMENFCSINFELLKCVKERTLDKKFKVRKEALLGFGRLYRHYVSTPAQLAVPDSESLSLIKNKLFHAYYPLSIESRILVERIFHTCLVPIQRPMNERMKLLYRLYCTVDENSMKAFREILRCQKSLRLQMKNILDIIKSDKNNNKQETLASKIAALSKNLQDPVKSTQYVKKFCSDIEANERLYGLMAAVARGNISCSETEHIVKQILKMLGNPVQTNTYYVIIKQLLERIAPVMVDQEGIQHLVKLVKNSLIGDCALEAELGLQNSSQRGLELLLALSFSFPSAFCDTGIFNDLLLLLQVEDESAADMVLQILLNSSVDLETLCPNVYTKLLPILEQFIEVGSPKQAKHAVRYMFAIVKDRVTVFGNILQTLKKHLTLESQYFRTALVSLGHIAYLCHDMFTTDLKTILQSFVKEVLFKDKELPRGGTEIWAPFDSLPDETKVKIEGMKFMVRWLAGLKDMVQPLASTLRLLTLVIERRGDISMNQHTAPFENSWLRLSAAKCMLKLCQEATYVASMTLTQFQNLAFVIHDPCLEVRDRFAQKLNKGLSTLKLPLEFLAIFALAGLDERKEFRAEVKRYLTNNITKRREYVKDHVLSNDDLLAYLPDYSLPYAIHLLAHLPFFTTYNDVPSLLKIKDCLSLLMEPLISKNENYSFSFFKRLLENIKQTKDKQAPDDSDANLKLYAVCDLALSLIISKKNISLKDFPAEPSLNTKFFTSPDMSYSNLKTYLPPELVNIKPQVTGIEIDIFEASTSSATNGPVDQDEITTNSDISEKSGKTSDVRPMNGEAESQNVSSKSQISSHRLRTKKRRDDSSTESRHEDSSNVSSVPSVNIACDISHNSDKLSEASEQISIIHPWSGSSATSGHSSADHYAGNKHEQEKKSDVRTRSKRSPRLMELRKSSSVNDTESNKQNGSVSSCETDINYLCDLDVRSLIKECNVRLNKDDVERYTGSSFSASSGSIILTDKKRTNFKRTSSVASSDSDSVNQATGDQAVKKRRGRPVRNRELNHPSPVVLKRKRESSPSARSVRAKTFSSVKNTQSAKETSTLTKSSTPLSSRLSPKINNSVKKNSKATTPRSKNISNKQKVSSPAKSSKQSSLKRPKRNQVNASAKRRLL